MNEDVETVSGPWFEDFEVGREFDAPAVTITEGHAAIYQSLFGDRLRLPLDRHASVAITGAGWLAHPLLAINVAIGQSTWASQRVKANLFYRGLVLRRPVHVGDTLYTRTRIVALRQNQSRAGRGATGIVGLEIVTRNQHGDTVLDFWRCPMIPCRLEATQTGHADDHHDRVVVDQAGLHGTEHRGEPSDQTGAAVDREAIDQHLIAGLPEATTEQAGAAGEHDLIDAIEVVLVLEQAVHRARSLA